MPELPNKELPKPRSRWRAVLSCVLTLVLVEVGVRLAQPTWNEHSPDEYAERVNGCARQQRDLIFVGGSPIAEGINPDHLGAITWQGSALNDVYCVGLSGGTTSDIYFGTRSACPQPPKVLVYGMTASDINDSRHEPHGVHSLLSWNDVQDWRVTRPEAAEWVTRHYAKDRALNLWASGQNAHAMRLWAAVQLASVVPSACPETVAEAQRQRLQHRDLTTKSGYVPTPWFASRQYDQMKAGGWVQPPFEYLARYKTGSHLKYLERLLDWAEESDVTVVLVDMPTTADLQARHPAEFAEYRSRLTQMCQRRGIRLLSANQQSTGLEDCHFADLIHLNRAGSDVLSRWMGDELRKLGAEPARSTVVRGQQP
jgi:hypothetical protein